MHPIRNSLTTLSSALGSIPGSVLTNSTLPARFTPDYHSTVTNPCGGTLVPPFTPPLYRDQSRIRKYSQLERGIDAFYEPALRIWHARRIFYQYFIYPLRYVAHQRELRAYELELIKLFKPKLNHPHCNSILKKLRIHVQQYTLPSTTLGLLGNTTIQKYYSNTIPTDQCALTVLHSRPTGLYNVLYQLGSNTRAKYEVARLLRSDQASLALLYLLYRYCGQLDEPHRTQATSLVTKALQFKGGHQPPANIPLQLHSLSIDHREQHRQWLRDFLQNHSTLKEFSCQSGPPNESGPPGMFQLVSCSML